MAAWTLPESIAQWIELLTFALDRRSRKYLAPFVLGMILSSGRRTVSSWLRAVGVGDDWQDHYYFLQTLGRSAAHVSLRLLLIALRHIPHSHVGEYVRLAIDDSPTKRYGPRVAGAGIHHNPTPGPAGSAFLYGHSWVTLSWLVRHPKWGCLGLPLRAQMYVRRTDLEAMQRADEAPWEFRTKLELAAELVEWSAQKCRDSLGKPVIVAADGAYAKREFLKRAQAAGTIVVSRLRKDAALYDLPEVPKRRGRGRPRKYGKNRLSLKKRGAHPRGWTTEELKLYGALQSVTYKTFLATYPPAGGTIRVVIVKNADGGWTAFFGTDPELSVAEILESVADRSAIEQNFHDVKEVHGAGQQQVRNVWSNVACWHLPLWLHTLVELWSWRRSGNTLRQRDDRPWEDAQRRPSHADRVNTLKKQVLEETFSRLPDRQRAARKIRSLFNTLKNLVT